MRRHLSPADPLPRGRLTAGDRAADPTPGTAARAAIGIALLAALFASGLWAQEFMYWAGVFPAIALPPLSAPGGVSEGAATLDLLLNGDAYLSADISDAAQLSGPGGDTLTTKYSVTFDGNGQGADSGADPVGYTLHDSFLASPVRITHVPGDDDVGVTLHVRAECPADRAPNAGAYSATATLTVTWAGL